ncbi:hypothetical protein [Marinivivus vitaminiproducens]|uniref:hypothetical protein n=1 Tax=Marinivivus vitaminiproducens TaxID=3035935 RepID=UPI0027AB06EA|nr:hypothetical protein P4R82_07015 [Geminicoccaceae bacterium SCSIO 64248]
MAIAWAAPATGQPLPAFDGRVDRLLQGLAPGKAAKPEVDVTAWIDRAPGGPVLRVALEPVGDTRLVPEPGIAVTPRERPGIDWRVELPLVVTEPGRDYWPAGKTLALPFAAEDGRPITVDVTYAYCLIGAQCFYGDRSLDVPTRPPVAN